MIVVDTNVVSEPLKAIGDPAVQRWLDQQSVETLYLTTISLAELRFGIALLPDGHRKDALSAAIEERIVAQFAPRILSFDTRSATAYAQVCAHAKRVGTPIGVADGYIAATAAARGFSVATRDTAPFEAAGLDVINPWKEG